MGFGTAVAWLAFTITGKGDYRNAANNSHPALLLMVFWTFVAAVMYYGYTGGLISALTKPTFESLPWTWEDLIKKDYVIKSMTDNGADDMNLEIFFGNRTRPVYSKMLDRLNGKDDRSAGFKDFEG